MSPPLQTVRACPGCGAAAVDGDHFCEACGAELPGPDPGSTGPAVPAAIASKAPVCGSCGAGLTDDGNGYCPVCGMKAPSPRDYTEFEAQGLGAVSDRGRTHPRNEDAFAVQGGDEVAAVVCDGVSTTVNPDRASQAAADAALAVINADRRDAPLRLVDAYAAARTAVEAVEGDPRPPALGWPSCTFLACIVAAMVVDVATSGDCRTYWLPATGDPALLTEDDSWAAEQVSTGAMSADDAYASPMAHTITRWLGRDADPGWRPRLVRFAAPGPGRLVLCSDGLWNYARTATDVAAAAGPGEALGVARRLTSFANDRGGHDNITVVVIDLPGGGDGDEPKEQTS